MKTFDDDFFIAVADEAPPRQIDIYDLIFLLAHAMLIMGFVFYGSVFCLIAACLCTGFELYAISLMREADDT